MGGAVFIFLSPRGCDFSAEGMPFFSFLDPLPPRSTSNWEGSLVFWGGYFLFSGSHAPCSYKIILIKKSVNTAICISNLLILSTPHGPFSKSPAVYHISAFNQLGNGRMWGVEYIGGGQQNRKNFGEGDINRNGAIRNVPKRRDKKKIDFQKIYSTPFLTHFMTMPNTRGCIRFWGCRKGFYFGKIPHPWINLLNKFNSPSQICTQSVLIYLANPALFLSLFL